MPRFLRAEFLAISISVSWAVSCGGGSGGSGGGGGGGGDGEIDPGRIPDPGASSFVVDPPFGTPADGVSEVEIRIQLISHLGRAIQGAEVRIDVSGFGNSLRPLPPTDLEGRTSGKFTSGAGERKRVSARVDVPRRVELGEREAVFLQIPANTWFVRGTGSDASSGRSPLEAWGTIDHALATVEPSATIHVGAGIHAGPFATSLDSEPGTPLVLHGDRDGDFTGDAGDVVLEAGGSPWSLRLHGARGIVLQDLTLRGAESGLLVEDSSSVRVLGCRVHENDIGVRVDGAQDLALQDCRISRNRLDGLRLADTLNASVENNLIYANGEGGLLLFSPAQGAAIRFNTFFRNQLDHLREEGAGGSGCIEENILAEGGGGSILLPAESSIVSQRNLVWGNVTRNLPRKDPNSSIEADPRFVAPCGPDRVLGGPGGEDDDFRVLPGSGALDLGELLARDVVLRSGEALSTRTTRHDQGLEWSGDDLPQTNLGFHYPVPPGEAFASLEPGGGRLLHAVPGEVRSRARAWDRAAVERVSELRAPALNAEIVWLEQRVSPLDRPEELIATLVDTGTSGQLLVRYWDGRRWSDPLASPFEQGIPGAELSDRSFDLEYEARSGRALLVTSAGDAPPRYRILEDGRWSAERSTYAATPGFGRIRWVELVPRPRSDDLALVTLTEQNDLGVALWDGESWTEPRMLEWNTLFSPGWRPFGAAFESLSGDLLVTWGFHIFAEEARWATLERATGTWRTGQHPSTDAVGAHVVLAADPTSDRIAAALGEADLGPDTSVAIWNGSTWIDTAELTLFGPVDSRLSEVAWIGNTGVAAAIFRRLGHSGSFNVALFLSTGWRIQQDVVLPGVGRATQIRLVSLPDRSQLLGLVLDEGGKLFGLRYEGWSFHLLNDGQPLAEGFDPAAAGRPFDVALRRP